MMRHKENPMLVSDLIDTLNSKDVWFVNIGASNHMTSHGEWFHDLWTPDHPSYVETGDDTTHPIRHIDLIHICKRYIEPINYHYNIIESLKENTH